jgi:pyridoxal phosphate enzyme (YggS family)
MADDESLAERLACVRSAIDDSILTADRDFGEVTTIVVTKFQPVSLIRELSSLGVRDFGESRHQEASLKVAELADLDATWHFVGQVQSKKARLVRSYVDVVHSVDRSSLVDVLAGETSVEVFLQVNLTDDPSRGGVAPAGLNALADRVVNTHGLVLRGVMAVAPLGEPPRRSFAAVRDLSESLRRNHPQAMSISMGMSGDFRDAIAEGATHLRIGTAITGNRPVAG